MNIKNLIFVLCTLPTVAICELNIVTTTTTVESIVKEIAGNKVKTTAISKGPQDPHYLEAKPSYMVTIGSADLVVANGLELESGWLPLILRGARNSKVQAGSKGYLELCSLIDPIEVPSKVDRAEGDVHPSGNPHCLLDPTRVSLIAPHISNKLSELDPVNKIYFDSNLKTFTERLAKEMVGWKARLSSVQHPFITYHKTLNYFLTRFNLTHAAFIEPKPGIPPTAKHIMNLISTIRTQKVGCVLIESFFETDSAVRLNKETNIPFKRVAAEAGALPNTSDYFSLIDSLISDVEQCKGMP